MLVRRFAVYLSLLLFFTTLPSSANESGNARPGWIDGQYGEEYPDNRFLKAVGSGPNRQAAVIEAKKQLAGIIRSKISSTTTTESKSSLRENTSAKVQGEGESNTTTKTDIGIEVDLKGVEIKSRFHDRKAKEHFALAVLDKVRARAVYSQELNKHKAKIEALYAEFAEKPTPGVAKEILTLADRFDTLNQELAAIAGPPLVTLSISAADLEKLRTAQRSLQEMRAIALEFTGAEGGEEFQELITSCLSERGVSVLAKVEAGKAPEYHVLYGLREKQKFMEVKGWNKYEFSSLAVIKRKNVLLERKLIAQEANGRTKDQAFDSIKEDLSEKICTHIALVVSR